MTATPTLLPPHLSNAIDRLVEADRIHQYFRNEPDLEGRKQRRDEARLALEVAIARLFSRVPS